jgi:hypothetical protein
MEMAMQGRFGDCHGDGRNSTSHYCPRVQKLKAALSASSHEIPAEAMSSLFEGIIAFLQERWTVLLAAAALPLSLSISKMPTSRYNDLPLLTPTLTLPSTATYIERQRKIQEEKIMNPE